MKTAFRTLIFSILTLASCNSSETASEHIVFNLKNADGQSFSALVHLPSGRSSDNAVPAVFVEDGRFFTEMSFWSAIDSMEECGAIGNVAIACLNDGNADGTGRTAFFAGTFIPYVQKKWGVGLTAGDRVCFGIAASADRCLTLSMQNDTLSDEYWCFSPSGTDLSEFGMLSTPTAYRICSSAAEEIEHFNFYPALVNSIRKRGGKADYWTFDNSMATKEIWWPYLFKEELKRRFPGQDSSLK